MWVGLKLLGTRRIMAVKRSEKRILEPLSPVQNFAENIRLFRMLMSDRGRRSWQMIWWPSNALVRRLGAKLELGKSTLEISHGRGMENIVRVHSTQGWKEDELQVRFIERSKPFGTPLASFTVSDVSTNDWLPKDVIDWRDRNHRKCHLHKRSHIMSAEYSINWGHAGLGIIAGLDSMTRGKGSPKPHLVTPPTFPKPSHTCNSTSSDIKYRSSSIASRISYPPSSTKTKPNPTPNPQSHLTPKKSCLPDAENPRNQAPPNALSPSVHTPTKSPNPTNPHPPSPPWKSPLHLQFFLRRRTRWRHRPLLLRSKKFSKALKLILRFGNKKPRQSPKKARRRSARHDLVMEMCASIGGSRRRRGKHREVGIFFLFYGFMNDSDWFLNRLKSWIYANDLPAREGGNK